MPNPKVVPRFFLYGDEAPDVDSSFLQCEMIPTRSGAHNWLIQPHAHPDHTQFLFVTDGGGRMDVEEASFAVLPPCVLVIPAMMVHGFQFIPGTDGIAVTVANTYIAAIAKHDKHLIAAPMQPAAYPLESDEVDTLRLRGTFELLASEFIHNAPGRRTAVMAYMLSILVASLRLRDFDNGRSGKHPHRDYDLVMRFRELVEEHFRQHKRLAFFAGALGTTEARLTTACRDLIGKSPAKVMHERTIIEAKRYLLFTGMAISEISDNLGFSDQAYFSRFFTTRVGCPPVKFRVTARASDFL